MVQAQFNCVTNADNTITIVGYSGAGGDVIIPTNINTLTVVGIGDSVFYGTGLTSVVVPASITNIGIQAFGNCGSLSNITVGPTNPFYSSLNGILFDKGATSLIQFPCGIAGNYTIPDGVTSISDHAFQDCINLADIMIPDSVTNIGNEAFSDCRGLTTMTIPYGVTRIGENAFDSCASLTNVTIPDSVVNIGDSACVDCFSLLSAIIPGSVKNIPDTMFAECFSMTNVTISESVTNIGSRAFYDCSGLTTLTMPKSIASINQYAFGFCTGLTNVFFTSNAPNVDSSAFLGCQATVYYLPFTTGWSNTLANLGAEGIQAPYTYTINGDGTINIAGHIGNGGEGIIPGTISGLPVTSIGDFAFASDSALRVIQIPNGVTNIGTDAFEACLGLTNITIPGSIFNIADFAFLGCANLTNVVIANGVTSIGNGSFAQCSSLLNVSIAAGVTNIGSTAFQYCYALTNITIPGSVTQIGYAAFASCTSLSNVLFTGNSPSMSLFAFGADPVTIYYLPGTTGWGSLFQYSGVLWNPLIQAGDSGFGVQSNRFGFNIAGTSNIPIVIGVCTNLANPVWLPLQSMTLTNGSYHFSDPMQTNICARFYAISFP